MLQLLRNNIEHLRQQNDLLAQYQSAQKNDRLRQIADDVRHKIHTQQNIQALYAYLKHNVYQKHQ